MSDEVLIGYAAFSNITYRGKWETGYTRAEWNELSREEQSEVMHELLFNDIDLWVIDDDEE